MGNAVSSPSYTCVYFSTVCGADPHSHPMLPHGEERNLPRDLVFSLKFLTYEQIAFCRRLCDLGQGHLFEGWGKLAPEDRRSFCRQLQKLDNLLQRGEVEPVDSVDGSIVEYDGGLAAYIEKIQHLLRQHRSRRGRWADWTASAPEATPLRLGNDDFDIAEQRGRLLMGRVGFVLNAFEKGSDALLSMPLEVLTGSSYMQAYIQHILVIQQRYGAGRKLPLCILTSKDTFLPIRRYLEGNQRFGMDPSQVQLLVPGSGVPLVASHKGDIVTTSQENQTELPTLPEGDGCFHAIMHDSGITKEWMKSGIQYVYFSEGANSLALQALPYMLHVTTKERLVLNYLTVPRRAKETNDTIVNLSRVSEQEDYQSTMICISHTELDSFLESTQCSLRDAPDEKSCHSPFPTATHTMLMQLKSYDKVLERTGGELPGSLTPTPPVGKKLWTERVRVTSRLTDICQVLIPEERELVGTTCMEEYFCHAPARLSGHLYRDGKVFYTAGTAEMALYDFHRRILRNIGCNVKQGPEQSFNDVKLTVGPNIIFDPSFCLTVSDYKDKFPAPENVKILRRSTLLVRGSGVTVYSLKLDGCLIVHCDEGFKLDLKKRVQNLGWHIVRPKTCDFDPTKGTRGYIVDRQSQKTVHAGEDPDCAIL